MEMNERIQELAEQAGLEFDNDLILESEPIYYTTQKDIEKFAVLIIRECALALDTTIAPLSHPMNSLGWKLKEHFGVGV